MLALVRTVVFLVLVSLAAASGAGQRPPQLAHGRRAELAAAPLSNAARLARGLPLRAPRRLYSPSRVHRSTPSAVPGQSYSGTIEIRKRATGDVVGYVAFPAVGNGNWDKSTAKAQTFTFTEPSDPSAASTLTDSTGARRLAIGDWYMARPSMKLSSNTYGDPAVVLTALDLPANSPPITDAATGLDVETAVWQVDPVTFKITPMWTNADLSQPDGMGFGIGGGWLYMVGLGNPSFQGASNGMMGSSNNFLVDLVFIPSPSA